MLDKDINISLLTNREWQIIDGEVCRVIEFIPMARIVNGRIQDINKFTPYAAVKIECKKLPGNITGYITHKIDFTHLWNAFVVRTIKADEEVVIIWTSKHYKWLYRLFAFIFAKLWVLVFHKGAYDLMIKSPEELKKEAKPLNLMPIAEWKPEVME